MLKEKKGKFKDFTTPGNKKEYKNKVIFLYKSKKGKHLFAFANEGNFLDCESILMNISDVEALIAEKVSYIKVSIMPHLEFKEESEDATKSG